MILYAIILSVLIYSALIGVILYGVAYVLTVKRPDPEKLSAYECGFDPFTTTYMVFDVRHYLVPILFIIFDLEISFLFPWSVVFLYTGSLGYFSILLFLIILTFGYIYEWLNNALDWKLVTACVCILIINELT
jgi:NADH:ubiquinone oxidoreductase subunit 3 (subunit A)